MDTQWWYCATDGSSQGYLYWMLYQFVDVNLLLCFFNLLPIPPLDGSRVLIYFLPPKAAVWFMRYSRVFYGVMFFLLITGVLSIPLSILELLTVRGLVWLASFLPVVM